MRVMGINIGSISVKSVILDNGREISNSILHHYGDPKSILDELSKNKDINYFGVSGHLGDINEIDAMEKMLENYKSKFDAVISLGGESFVIYTLQKNKIFSVISQNRCAAGSGEFLVQQLGRLNLSLSEAIEFGFRGRSIYLASRCSVHCKSDITHKLNKGEAKIEDIIYSIHKMISDKIISMLDKIRKDLSNVLIIGGLSQNRLLMHILKKGLPNVNLHIRPESLYFEALGTAFLTQTNPVHKTPFLSINSTFESLPGYSKWDSYVRIIQEEELLISKLVSNVILGIDGGSTTTKIVAIDPESNRILSSHYTRTNGDPLGATQRCLKSIFNHLGEVNIKIIATTGSAREIIGAYLGTSHIYNEISAHATGSLYFDPEVDTIFEIGGQDAKYIYIENGIPVDYAMNAACSAGTGSFLEESCNSDLGVKVEEISNIALSSLNPIKFKSECAAFINSDIRFGLQEGYSRIDIIAGLVNSIVNNYLTKVKGPRRVGKKIFLQGGVAKNQAIAYAFAQATSKQIIVPPLPELMGAYGVALMAINRNNDISSEISLNSLLARKMERLNSFTCRACENYCDISRFSVEGRKFPFGGQCSKYENYWKGTAKQKEVVDYVQLRNDLIFSINQNKIKNNGSLIGIPKALSTHSLFPLYYEFLRSLNFRPILSDIDPNGNLHANAPFCYPTQIAHGAVLDLVDRLKVDFIFLPQIQRMPSDINNSSYLCPITQASPYLLEKAFKTIKFLTPSLNFDTGYPSSRDLVNYFVKEFKLPIKEVQKAYDIAVETQIRIEEKLHNLGSEALNAAIKSKKPAIILVGRSYNAYPKETSQAISKKLTSKGIITIPGDTLMMDLSPYTSWYFPNLVLTAAQLCKSYDNLFLLYVSNFGCNIDTFTQEYLRDHLFNKPYLKLDIDSHTADAGTQTRLEAFYEIINNYTHKTHQNQIRDEVCRIQINGGSYKIKTSEDEFIEFTDKRVKFHFPIFSKYHNDIFPIAMKWAGYNAPKPMKLTAENLETGLQYTSGSECIPFPIFLGQIMELYDKKDENDIIGVYMIAGGAPCVIVSYVDVLNKFIKENQLKNIFVFAPSLENKFYNMERLKLFRSFPLLISLADIVTEIKNVLLVASRKPEIDKFENYWMKLINSLFTPRHFNGALEEFIRHLGQLQLHSDPKECPKIVLSGDFFVRFDDFFYQGLTEKYAKKGIILKIVDLNELLLYAHYDIMLDASDHLGLPKSYRLNPINAAKKLRNNSARKYLIHWMSIKFSERYERNLRKKFENTGLLISEKNDIESVVVLASKHINRTIYGESVLTIGKGVEAIVKNYDGLIILGPFSCLPFRISEAILKPLCWENDFPFLSYETDGRGIPPSVQRLVDVHIQQVLRKFSGQLSPRYLIKLPTIS